MSVSVTALMRLLLCVLLLAPLPALAGTVVRVSTALGDFDIELLDDTAPVTVPNFLAYLNKGQFFGVDTFTSSQCDSSDASANVNGMIAGAGAFHWGLGQLVSEPMDSNIIDMGIPGTPVLGRLERIRSGGTGTTRWMQRFVFGCIEGIDAAAVRVRSDAP